MNILNVIIRVCIIKLYCSLILLLDYVATRIILSYNQFFNYPYPLLNSNSFQFVPLPNSSTSLLIISHHLNFGFLKGLYFIGFCSRTILSRHFWLLIACLALHSLSFLIFPSAMLFSLNISCNSVFSSPFSCGVIF